MDSLTCALPDSAYALSARVSAAWQALSCEVRRMQLLAGRANLQATKHAFGLLSRAFSSWHQQVILLKRLELVVDTVQASCWYCCRMTGGGCLEAQAQLGGRTLPVGVLGRPHVQPCCRFTTVVDAC
jgi:hypothetical protein